MGSEPPSLLLCGFVVAAVLMPLSQLRRLSEVRSAVPSMLLGHVRNQRMGHRAPALTNCVAWTFSQCVQICSYLCYLRVLPADLTPGMRSTLHASRFAHNAWPFIRLDDRLSYVMCKTCSHISGRLAGGGGQHVHGHSLRPADLQALVCGSSPLRRRSHRPLGKWQLASKVGRRDGHCVCVLGSGELGEICSCDARAAALPILGRAGYVPAHPTCGPAGSCRVGAPGWCNAVHRYLP